MDVLSVAESDLKKSVHSLQFELAEQTVTLNIKDAEIQVLKVNLLLYQMLNTLSLTQHELKEKVASLEFDIFEVTESLEEKDDEIHLLKVKFLRIIFDCSGYFRIIMSLIIIFQDQRYFNVEYFVVAVGQTDYWC